MANFAVVTGVYSDGLALRIEGESAESRKHYQCNAFEVFHTGARVRIVQDGNTYVAEYVVGNPKTTFAAARLHLRPPTIAHSRRQRHG
jgi:hypothetical protein